MDKILIVCGPTATGKTKFALEIAKEFDGELVSADSRQVYIGRNLIYGKDIPPKLKSQRSKVKWKDRRFRFYEIEGIKIWLYDIVEQGEEFSVALWRECAQLVIEDILSRGKLPIIVGGTGLYIKSLTTNLTDIAASRNMTLRKELADKNVEFLWNYLHQIKPTYLNSSDRKNPRRLIRAIEIALSNSRTYNLEPITYSFLQIGLTASQPELFRRVEKRIDQRITAGATEEDPILSASPNLWKHQEQKIVRQQLTWFKKQLNINWYDITDKNWQKRAEELIQKWYNTFDAAQS